MTSHRRHRFSRSSLRGDLLGLAQRIIWTLLATGFFAWAYDLWSSTIFWIVSALALAYAIWQGWRESVFERTRWEEKRRLEVWFEPGVIHMRRNTGEHEAHALDGVTSIEAITVGGRVTRLLVDDSTGQRTIYTGFEDMEAFADDLRRAIPKVPFRRMRIAFTGKLKEIP